jgi:hypothetical protein
MLLLCSKVLASGKYASKKVIAFDTATEIKFVDLEGDSEEASSLNAGSGTSSALKRFFSGDISKDTVCLVVEKPGSDGKSQQKEYRFVLFPKQKKKKKKDELTRSCDCGMRICRFRTFSAADKKHWMDAFKKVVDIRNAPKSPRGAGTSSSGATPSSQTSVMGSNGDPGKKQSSPAEKAKQVTKTGRQRALATSFVGFLFLFCFGFFFVFFVFF